MIDEDGDDRVRAMLERARAEMAKGPPLAPAVRARLDGVSIAPRPRASQYLLVAAAVIAIGASTAWIVRQIPNSSMPTAALPEARRLQPLPASVGGLDLGPSTCIQQHLSMLIDSRTVLVFWSWRDAEAPGPDAGNEDRSPSQAGNYTEWRLNSGRDPDGTAWQWSLFIANPGVFPVAEPPAVCVRDTQFGQIRLAITPQTCSREDLRCAIETVVTGARKAPTLKDIEEIVAGYEG